MVRAMVVIGASLGGFDALEAVLAGLSDVFPWPVAIVQHRSVEGHSDGLAAALQRCCRLPVSEVDDKDPVEPGHVYVAPADYHLLLDHGSFALSTDARVCFARPSIDVLFDSAAAVCGPGLVAVVLTGSSVDGAQGVVRVKAEGGTVFVQDPLTAESPVAPRAAIAAAKVDRVLPLEEIAQALNVLAASRW